MIADTGLRTRPKNTRNKIRRTATLSPSLIQRTALDIVDRLGLEGLTVRKLAEELGVTPMAVYRHFENKGAIEGTLVDLVVGDYDVTNHDETDFRDWLCTTFISMRHALCEHPGIIPLLSGATYSGSNALQVLEQVLQRLREAEISSADGTRLFYALMAYTIGSVVLMDGVALSHYGAAETTQLKLRRQRHHDFESFSRESYPCVVEAAPHLAVHFGGDCFATGLVGIIAGILAVSA